MLNHRHLSSAVLVLAAVVFSATCFALAGFAQTPSFSAHSAATSTGISQYNDVNGDLNGDGYEDLITGTGSSFSVRLSNGDGTYRAPITYAIPNYSTPVLLGDFNGDGKLDLVVENCPPSTDCNGYSLYFGNGDGTFQAPVKHMVSGGLLEVMGAADVNHDNKTDLLVLTTNDNYNSSDLQVFFANGDGTFSNGPTTHISYGATVLLTGDFDGDGKADVALQLGSEGGVQIEVLSGDGTGNFTVTYTNSNSSQGFFEAADVNGDGISDLISTDSYYCVGCTGEVPDLIVYYGATDRKMQYAQIPTTGCPTSEGGDQIAVADFNGDGIPDIAFAQNTNCNSPTSTNIAILSGKGNNQFGSQTSVYTTTNIIQPGTYALRGNRDTKADLVFSEDNSQSVFTIVTLLNTTTGNFPTCAAPNAAVGINVCSPTPGGSASSPVNFAIGAAGDTPMQRVELWTDGHKAAQQFAGAFSHYSFMNTSVPLGAGSHRIVVFAAGTDNSLQEKVFYINVGTSSCSAPTSAGVHICSPANGSTVSSPVQVEASGTVTGTISHMELWVDGVKKDSAAGAVLNTSISLAAGSHRFAVLALNTAGQKWENAVDATVK